MKTRLIVGLGNPGEKYQHNRHNAGFILVDVISEAPQDNWRLNKNFNALTFEKQEPELKTIFFKPQTFMNLSGQAVRAAKDFYKIENSFITVIHDELDLPFGEVRQKTGGGSAGHKGVQSVIDHIGEDFHRIRIGVRNELTDIVEAEKFVLSNFSKDEYENLIRLAVKISS